MVDAALNTATAHRNHYREAFSRLHGISPSQAREKADAQGISTSILSYSNKGSGGYGLQDC
ncbi:hypothetical protein PO124_23435 [Bacillus licheniformis]|nr:hypothetical protein [Bacillus licheniformis]